MLFCLYSVGIRLSGYFFGANRKEQNEKHFNDFMLLLLMLAPFLYSHTQTTAHRTPISIMIVTRLELF